MILIKLTQLRSACLLALLSMAISINPVMAQQPTPAPVTTTSTSYSESTKSGDNNYSKESPKESLESMEEMRAVIKQLTTRVAELEAKLNESQGAGLAGTKKLEIPTKQAEQSVNTPEKDTAAAPSFFEKTEISGFVDGYYGYNFNRPQGNSSILQFDNQLRNFDTKHNQFSLNMIKLALENKPTVNSRLGFRLDLSFGPATEIIHASEPGGSDFVKNIQQGYLSYLAPVGKGLQIDFGKYSTHHGFEVIETKDNWNYSRSLLFTLGIPYYHFGVRTTYPVNDKVSVMFGVNNGWNSVVDNNSRKSYCAQVSLKPTEKLSIVQNYMGGPEQAGNNKDWRHLFDTVVSYQATPTVSLATNYVYGFDRLAGARVHWQGIVGYARYQINQRFALSPRFEYYDDHDGFTSGLRQTLKSAVITAEHNIREGLSTRLEYRHDSSNEKFFSKPSDRLVKGQTTLTLGIVYSFNSKK
ncbi:MAG: porin [Acidobacteriota bacterium]